MQNNKTYSQKVFVVIAVHNRRNITDECLKRIESQTYKLTKVVIIDDGSTDGTDEMIKNKYPNSIYLKGDGTFWWSKSMNLGIEYVLANSKNNDLVLTLNDDTIFYDNFIEDFVNESKIYPNHLIGSINLIKDSNPKYFSAGGKYDLFFSRHKPNVKLNQPYIENKKIKYYETDFLPGRGTLIPIEVFKNIGFYDHKNYPQYIADEEFSFRSKKAGYKCIVSSKVLIYVKKNNSGFENTNSRKTIKTFIQSLSAINSTNNIKCRINFAKTYAKIPLIFISINLIKMFLTNIFEIVGIRK